MEISAIPYVSMILGTFGASLIAMVALMISDRFNQQKNRPVNEKTRASRVQSAVCQGPVAA
ncbi:MAG: hypothetical protein JWR16_1515 [Nevskia sp.]|nr:hypothetical protein [Nevskia sp.]